MGQHWSNLPISHIEDLRDAVYGAGLEATQMASGALRGSLVFSDWGGVVVSSGLINGHVALRGPLSQDKITLGIGLELAPGSKHWLTEVATGDVGVFHAGDEHDAFYVPGSLYATLTMSSERLREEAAREGLVLDRATLGGTGIRSRRVPPGVLAQMRHQFQRVHCGGPPVIAGEPGLCTMLLGTLLNQVAREPHPVRGRARITGHARVLARARAYIMAHLGEPIALDDIAAAACASRRTLQRAFAEILEDTPQTYVRRLRLHRIRAGLAGDAERACTIAVIANQWGITELGRMSRWYRELFGERPSETIAHAKERHGVDTSALLH
jgi:AraC-like DNA-binding protein